MSENLGLDLDLDLDLDSAINNAGGADLQWSGDAPVFEDATSKNLNDYKVTGFIAGKYNYLSPSHRRKEGEELYKNVYAEAIAQGRKTYEVMKENEEGQLESTGKEETLGEGFSLKALLALDPDAYYQIKKGAYRVTTPERDPEFLIITNFNQLEKAKADPEAELDTTGQYVEDYVEAISKNKAVNIIRPRDLVQIAFETQTERVDIVNFDHTSNTSYQRLGWLVPYAVLNTNSGVPKLNFRSKFYTSERVKVTKLGDFLELPRAFNRSYRGERPSDIVSIENEEFLKNTLPHVDINELTILKTSANLPEGVKLRQNEEIPYEEQEALWKKLGVEPAMLKAIRTSSSATTSVSNKDIKDIFEKGLRAFRTFKKATL